MKCDEVVEYKESLTGCVPIVEEIEVKECKDVSKLKQQCARCHKVRVTRPHSTPLITESNPTGVHWLCRECSKPVVLELRDYPSIEAKLKILEFFQELTVPQVFQISVNSPALKGFSKAWYVELRKKFHLELTKKEALFSPWVDSHAERVLVKDGKVVV